MKVDLLVDIGNSRMKWGIIDPAATTIHGAALPPDDPAAWQRQLEAWGLGQPLSWAVSGVAPSYRDGLVAWLRQRGDTVWVVEKASQLPLTVGLDKPDHVGIDRLLAAVAAARHGRRSRLPAIIVDAGSAVTVDWVDEQGVFRGGAIFPGLRLMAKALNDYTALLPLVTIEQPHPPLPGLSTPQAMQAGIFHAVVGGINTLIARLNTHCSQQPAVYLTGGDGELLHAAIDAPAEPWPEMTLEGLRLTIEAQP
ncbi:MAG: type III pantothenate kinase [Gemmataceae bacterium]